MVKFTFASIFLTLASVFALVSAVPAAPSYSISSVGTKEVILSDGSEQVGDIVFTIPPSQANSDNSLLTIYPPPGEGSQSHTVQGKAGLYIASFHYPRRQHLIWIREPYNWVFSLRPSGAYLVNIPYLDAYWSSDAFDDFTVKPGRDIATEGQAAFTITANTGQ